MKSYTIHELSIGQSASFTKTISEFDVYAFAGISGDFNPAHVNKEYAENTRFKGRIAHGVIAIGLLSGTMATQLPGPGTIYLGHELKFLKPVYIDDTITAIATVKELIPEKNIARFLTECTNQRGETVVTGIATVMPPKEVV